MAEVQPVMQKVAGPDPLIGRVIADRYRITSLIARGGMGKVYLAEQAPLGRKCAVKVLNPNYNGDADPEFHRRFFREASITAKITHPNSVTIFDYGKTDDDIYFMVMEYLEGQTLHQAIKSEHILEELRVGRIAVQVCRAVREAHRLGVIHRDLKPANIFLLRPGVHLPGPNGTMPPPSDEEGDFVKVLDFGLVKDLSERPEEQLTQTGLFMGSPKYMAPEQIQGGHVDERTDIYSLGIILYECLAGKVPFERATSVSILMAHVAEQPPTMREVNPNLVCSPGFEEVVMTCIAKEPDRRFSTMDELLAAIRRVHGGSMTGQLAALVASGQFRSVSGSVPPVARRVNSASGLTPPGVAIGTVPPNHSWPPPAGQQRRPANGTQPIAPLQIRTKKTAPYAKKAEPGPLLDSMPPSEASPRSKSWLVAGGLVAAGIGGALGLLAFHYTAPPPVAPTPAATANETSQPPKVEPAPPTTAPAAVVAPMLKVTSDPAGATVREDGKELCAATPCDVTLKADDPAKPHKIVIAHPGYKPETHSVKATDGAIAVKLTRSK